MIRVFDLDEPTTEIEVPPDTVVRQVDLMYYLERNQLKYVGGPCLAREVPITEAMLVDLGFEDLGQEDCFGATVVMRVRTPTEKAQAAAAH